MWHLHALVVPRLPRGGRACHANINTTCSKRYACVLDLRPWKHMDLCRCSASDVCRVDSIPQCGNDGSLGAGAELTFCNPETCNHLGISFGAGGLVGTSSDFVYFSVVANDATCEDSCGAHMRSVLAAVACHSPLGAAWRHALCFTACVNLAGLVASGEMVQQLQALESSCARGEA